MVHQSYVLLLYPESGGNRATANLPSLIFISVFKNQSEAITRRCRHGDTEILRRFVFVQATVQIYF